MGVLKNFSLEVDPSTNPNGVYYTGQVVTGVVQINLKEPIRMRGIRLTFTGAANVKWTKISGEKRENYKSKEKYVDQTIVIYGKAVGDKGDAQTHPAGLYRYPFRVQIPANIPSTFSGKFGHIAYSLKATIDKPWKLNSNTKPLVLTIHKYIDLNREPNAHIAPQGQASLDIRRLCCFSGSVQVTCSTSKSGYTPGETVVVHSQIENSSGKRLHSLHAKLTKEVTYHDTKGSSHKHSELVTDTKLSPVPQPEKDFWSGHLQLELPATATPFRLDNCNIIDLRYKVLFTVTVKGGNKVRAELPVSVGSEPVPVPGHNRDNLQRSQSWSPVTLEHNPFPPTLNGTVSSKQRQQFPIPGAPAPSLSHVFYNHHQPHAQTMQFVPPPYLINNQASGEPYPGPSANPVFMSIPRQGISHQISPPAEFGGVPPQHPERPPLLPTAPPPYSP